jgi:4-diphosphocytidyl-2-C-methyl-D-erythritol kinase
MKKLSAPSYTRITLALDIIGKITRGPFTGFHELSTVKHLINLHDIISVEESKDFRIICSNPAVPLDATNTCHKVAEALKQRYNIPDNVTITINKNIPVKGGLAGGSANAATTMLLLCDMWDLSPDADTMVEIARSIGQDIPFYFFGPSAHDTEAGGHIETIMSNLRFDIILVMPDFGVSTKDAYATLDYALIGKYTNKTSLLQLAMQNNDRDAVLKNMHNDFELSVFKKHPKLAHIQSTLLENGCPGAIMSGSGSTVFGILESSKDYERIKKKIGFPTMLVSSSHGWRNAALSKRGMTVAIDNYEEKRTDKFRWHSKQELCDYFGTKYGLSKTLIDAEIEDIMKIFKLRNYKAIQTIELWQKVGLHLEKKVKEYAEDDGEDTKGI